MMRTKQLSAVWRSAGAALGFAAAVVLAACPAQAELVQQFFPIEGGPPTFQENKGQFQLLFSGRLADDGQPPAFNPAIPFNLTFDWQVASVDPLTGVVTFNPVSTFDRATLRDAGVPGIPAGDPLWRFNFGLSTGFTTDPMTGQLTGVLNLQGFLQGEHLDGPTAQDVDPNPLPLIRSRPVTAMAGQVIRQLAAGAQVDHKHNDGTPSVDRYLFDSTFEVLANLTDPLVRPPNITPNVVLQAQHLHAAPPGRPGQPPGQTGWTTGSTQSFGFFDRDRLRLTLSGGQLDFTAPAPVRCGGCEGVSPNWGGEGGSGMGAGMPGMDYDFSDDPLYQNFSFFEIVSADGDPSELPYLGFDADRQVHVFSGGSLEIVSFGSFFTFASTFPEMLYDPVSDTFSALLDTISYTDLLSGAPSKFLDVFTKAHLAGGDPSSTGIQFTFRIPGLDEASNNFTETFFPEEPFGMFLTGVLIPEPTSLILLLLGGALLSVAKDGWGRSSRQSLTSADSCKW